MQHSRQSPELSLLIAFSSCEETIGGQVRATADYLRRFGRPFEIIAVNEGSHDNSVAMLHLLDREIPELTVVARDVQGRAFARAAVEAQGSVLVLTSTHDDAELGPWASLGWALGRLDNRTDAVINRGRYIVARRASCLPIIGRLRGHSLDFPRQMERQPRGLHIELVGSRREDTTLSTLREAWKAPLRRLAAAARW